MSLVITDKIVLYQDLHLKVIDPLGVPTEDGLNTRVHRKIESLERVIDFAVYSGAKTIVDLGDLFHSINPADKLRNIYARTIQNGIKQRIRFIRILGNHETDGKEGVGSDVGIIADPNNFRVIGGIERENGILFIPEIDNEEIQKALQTFTDDLVFGHFGVEGAVYPSGTKEQNAISAKLIESRKWPCFLGHIHKGQVLCGGKAIYIGALCRNDFGDKNVETGCCLLEITRSENGIENVSYKYQSIQDVDFVDIIFKEHEGELGEGLRQGRLNNITKNSIVRLIYNGSSEWFSSCDVEKIKQQLYDKQVGKVIVSFELSSNVREEDLVKSFDQIDYRQMITQTATENQKDPKLGLHYFEEALRSVAN